MTAGRIALALACSALGGCWVALDLDDNVYTLGPGEGGGGSTTTTGDGPVMVLVSPPGHDAFLIDAMEVTVEAYDAWLKTSPSTASQDPRCEWNTSFVPGVCDPTGDCLCDAFGITLEAELLVSPSLPVRCVDFCDAVAFCRDQGKHLCGGIDGVTLFGAPDVGNDPAQSEWFFACSNGGAQEFPYGSTFDAGRCVDATIDSSRPRDVGKPACQGGVAGVFDMSGNVEEWVDHCYQVDPPGTGLACFRAGGAYWSDTSAPDWLDCDIWWEQSTTMREQSPSTGFRCCDIP